jgi:hypothetical protein
MIDVINKNVVVVGSSVNALRLTDGAHSWQAPVLLNGEIVQATPCSDGVNWYIFTTAGTAWALTAKSGEKLWSKSVTGGNPGFSSSCAVIPGADGAYVAAGAHDFSAYILKSATGGLVCSYASGAPITQGISADLSANTFIVPSTDNKVYVIKQNSGTCSKLLVIEGVFGPSKVALDGMGAVVVGHASGLLKIRRNGTIAWNYSTSLEPFNAPAIGPHGTVYVTTQAPDEVPLLSVGVTTTFIEAHMRGAVMKASANVDDVGAHAELSFLCTVATLAPAAQIQSAKDQVCTMLALIESGRFPWGLPQNYASTYAGADYYTNLLKTDVKPFLADAQDSVSALEMDVASVDAQIASAKATLGSYSQRLASQQQSLAKTQDFIKDIG